jgi:prevent-host-death family protein
VNTKVYSSEQARAKLRDVLDTAVAGQNIIIERYGKPTVAVIAYEDFVKYSDLLQHVRDARKTNTALEE